MKDHWLTDVRRVTETRLRRASKLRLNGALFDWWLALVPGLASNAWDKVNE
jgi:hypothetical protein